jgi:hypothetical protein
MFNINNVSTNNIEFIFSVKNLIFLGVSLSEKERGGLYVSIFSKQKRIYAAIPNANFIDTNITPTI